MALENSRARPGRERRLGSGNGLLGFLDSGAGIDAHHFIDIGRVDILDPIRADPFAVDQVLVQFGHGKAFRLVR
ncbi:hypothetical protein D3C72_2296830 [compost metagenome]